ncbi:MAG TPA: hypothetical protein VF171_08855 [Trueperaceae bacterium]
MHVTQKANGLELVRHLLSEKLWHLRFAVPQFEVISAKEVDAFTSDRLQEALHTLKLAGPPHELMVRPAPVTPRHGFVESERINASGDALLDNLKRIARTVTQLEPQGEIILMPFVNAECSMVLTSAGLTIGPGHDGATSGRDSKFLPVACDLRAFVQRHAGEALRARYGIAEDQDVYLEAVAAGPQVHLTQVRAGPKVENARDFIPASLTVRRVVRVTTQDLLAWEHTVQELSHEPGVVVWHAGGSVCSHYGVHCVIHGVPYLTSRRPRVGEQLEPTPTRAWGEPEYRALAARTRAFASDLEAADDTTLTSWTVLAVAALHALPSLLCSASEEALRVVGFALAFLPRLFTGLCAGEVRHARAHLSSYDAQLARSKLMPVVSEARDRSTIYREAMILPLAECSDALARSYGLFRAPGWSSEFGGEAWAACALASATFLDAVRAFVVEPNEPNFQRALGQFNQVVHLAHNSGWWLNKIMMQESFDVLAEMPCLGFLGCATLEVLQRPLANDAAPWPNFDTVTAAHQAEDAVRAHLYPRQKEPAGAWRALKTPTGTPDTLRGVRWTLRDSGLHVQARTSRTHPAKNRPYGAAFDLPSDTEHKAALVMLFRHLMGRHDVPRVRSLATENHAYGRAWLGCSGERLVMVIAASLRDDDSYLQRFVMTPDRLGFELPRTALPEFAALFAEEVSACPTAA